MCAGETYICINLLLQKYISKYMQPYIIHENKRLETFEKM